MFKHCGCGHAAASGTLGGGGRASRMAVMNDMRNDVEPVLLKPCIIYYLRIIRSLYTVRLDMYVDVSFDCALVFVDISTVT